MKKCKELILKLILFTVICQISIFAFAQNFSSGAYLNSSNQSAIFNNKSDFLKPQKLMFSGWEYGVFLDYRISNNFSLKTRIGYSQNSLTLSNSFISSFQYNNIPINIVAKSTVLSFSNFDIYIENGMSMAFCNSYSYNRVIGGSNSNLTGTISDFNFTNNVSYGFINGFGILFRIKSKFEIDVFANYYSGINKVWENNSISINEDGRINTYTVSSNGSSLNIGLGLGYCF
ncbi:MAG: hypothetical protein PHZ24_11505 [Bacteroidales bacterium]|nr:hypothetical protein [Bacteroidales bacterium]MDY0140798.1 hypothetical protein [Bacteroidales bacterium]